VGLRPLLVSRKTTARESKPRTLCWLVALHLVVDHQRLPGDPRARDDTVKTNGVCVCVCGA
jgi:hypothetical protein